MGVPSDHRESRDLTCPLKPLAATIEENYLNPAIATDPKTAKNNPCIGHASEPPWGPYHPVLARLFRPPEERN